MTQTQDQAGAVTRFLRFTTKKQPAVSISLIAAIVMALLARYLHLTEDDLALFGPIVVILVGVVIRAKVFSPWTHELGIAEALEEGKRDGAANAVQPPDPVTMRRRQAR